MAAEGGRIDFMFLGPPPYPAAGSATGAPYDARVKNLIRSVKPVVGMVRDILCEWRVEVCYQKDSEAQNISLKLEIFVVREWRSAQAEWPKKLILSV